MGPNSADLARLSATVLADCAFLLTAPVEDDAEPDDPVHAVIAFRGATSGRLVLSASRDLAEIVAADMMGLSIGDPEARAHAEGAVAELANVLLGMLVVKFCDCESSWDLGTPKVHVGTLPVLSGSSAQAATLASDTGSILRVQWLTDGSVMP